MAELKKLSPLERKFLEKLGEKPADHQAVVHALLNKTYTTKLSTKKEPNVHQLNKQVESRLSSSLPASTIAANLEAKTFVAEEWIPDAYVLFTRHWRCRCGQVGVCLERSELYLRHHHIHQRKRYKENENGPGFRYLPVKVLAYESLPRLREVVFKSLVVCEACFEKSKGVVTCPEPRPSVSVVTESLTQTEPQVLPRSELESTLPSPSSLTSSLPDTSTGSIGMASSSDSPRGSLSELISAVFAELTSFPTNEVANAS